MEIRGLTFLPFLGVTWTLLGICGLVTLTVLSGHKEYPYISDTGNEFPESAVYQVVFLVSSILGVGVTLIQYRFMRIRSEPSKWYIISQRILLVIGWIACTGDTVNAMNSRLLLTLSREDVSICLREKTQDPENP